MALTGEPATVATVETRDTPEPRKHDAEPVLQEQRDALIELAKQRLLAVARGQVVDAGMAAAHLAQAEAALRVAKLDETQATERLRRSLAYFALVVGIVLLSLASCHIKRIEVEGVVRSESLYFRTSDLVVLDLEASTPIFSAALGDGESGSASVREPVDLEAQDSGQIAINQIALSKGSEAQISMTREGIISLQVRCDAGCDSAWVNLTFSGSVMSRGDPSAVRKAGAVELHFAGGENYLEFQLRDSVSLSGTSVIRADSVAFNRDHFRVTGDLERSVNAPTVVSGEIRNLTMNGQRHVLSRNDHLTIGSGPFSLRSVRLEHGTLVTEFTGKPSELAREGRGLVPSTLEWLWTRQPLAIFWTLLASLVATMAAAIGWKPVS